MHAEDSAMASFGPTIWGVPDGAVAFLLRQRLSEHQGTIVHVAHDDAALASLADMLSWLVPEVMVLRFPAWDCLPYDRISPNPSIVAERTATLSHLLEPAPPTGRIVLTTIHAMIQRVPPRAAFAGQTLHIKRGDMVEANHLAEQLVGNGYSRVDTVMERGEFAMRGSIFDLYPADAGEPVRLDFFGDEVDNIRNFDAATQRSTEAREGFSLTPVSEYALDKASLSRFQTGWRDVFGSGAMEDVLYRQLLEGRRASGAEIGRAHV